MPGPSSLRDLVNQASARRFLEAASPEPRSLTDTIAFPFLAIVAQREMKLALLLALINPGINGVLLVGPRGTGKTTAVRSLTDLLPFVHRSVTSSDRVTSSTVVAPPVTDPLIWKVTGVATVGVTILTAPGSWMEWRWPRLSVKL